MPKFRKKPIVIEAHQWFKSGDHPDVQEYPNPEDVVLDSCGKCGGKVDEHGWVQTLEGGHIVCPGDWIIIGIAGEKYPCKNAIFQETYEPVEE